MPSYDCRSERRVKKLGKPAPVPPKDLSPSVWVCHSSTDRLVLEFFRHRFEVPKRTAPMVTGYLALVTSKANPKEAGPPKLSRKALKAKPKPAAATTKPAPSVALSIEAATINEHCTGKRWVTIDSDRLARIAAIVAMGQAAHAAHIIAMLLPATPALNHVALRIDARRRLSVQGSTQEECDASRVHRDGLIFETISWVAAHQEVTGNAVIRDPHLSSTMPGLDGLMIELDSSGSAIVRATIFEDKCSENPRRAFRDKILPAFQKHHANERASDLLASAAILLEKAGLAGPQAVAAAEAVLSMRSRVYRGSLAVTNAEDSPGARKRLFEGYDALKDIEPAQRIGATFVTSDNLRNWFDELATRAIAYIESLGSLES